MLACDFCFAGGVETSGAGLIDGDVVDEGGVFGGEFKIVPPTEPGRVLTLSDDASADIAAGNGQGTSWFVRLREADFGGGGRAAGLGKVFAGFVSDVFVALSNSEF